MGDDQSVIPHCWPGEGTVVHCRPVKGPSAPLYLRQVDGEVHMSAVGFHSAGLPCDVSEVVGWLASDQWESYLLPAGAVPDSVPWRPHDSDRSQATARTASARQVIDL